MIDQRVEICEACWNEKAVERHHFLLRGKLKKSEKKLHKFTVYLGKDCHDLYLAADKKHNGWKWFIKFPHMVELCLKRCDYDIRFERFLTELYEYNKKQKGLK